MSDDLFLNVTFENEEITFDEIFNSTFQEVINSSENTSPILKVIFVIFFRFGLILIQTGCIPIQNIYFILLKHILDVGVCLISYAFIGFTIASIKHSWHGFCGYGTWLNDIKWLNYSYEGFLTALMGSGIICTNLSARMHFIGLGVLTFVYSGLIAPLIAHWSSEKGFFSHKKWSGQLVSLKDHGNILEIHLTSALVSALGIIFLSRRILVVRSIDPLSIGLDSINKILVGYSFLMAGIIIFELPTIYYDQRHAGGGVGGLILFNNLIALGTSFLLISILHILVFKGYIFCYLNFTRSFQAGVASMVAICGGVDIMTPLSCFFISIMSTGLYFSVALGLHESAYEDPCNVVAVHFVCGLLGHICTALFASGENFGIMNPNGSAHLFWQLYTFLVTFVFALIIFLILFSIISALGILRTELESRNHQMAMGIKQKKRRRCFKRLFNVSKKRVLYGPTSVLLAFQIGQVPYKLTYNAKRMQHRDHYDTDIV